MLKIHQASLQQYVNHELPDVQAGFRKGRGTRDQIANICWVVEKSKRVPEKHLFLLYWLCQSLDSVDHNKLENSEREGNTRTPDLPLEKPVCRSGRSPGGGHSNPLQYSCLENPMDRGAWRPQTVHGVTKSQTHLKQLSMHGLQHARLPCPSLSPGLCWSSCPLS